MNVTPKRYQAEARDSVLEIFRYACKQIDEAEDLQSRLAASAYNGCVLIQAPTGAGKTLIAGMVAEEFSKETKIVWLWFTPLCRTGGTGAYLHQIRFPGASGAGHLLRACCPWDTQW